MRVSQATSSLCRLNDGLFDSVAQLYKRRQAEDRALTQVTRKAPWDPSVWRYTPPALRGVKPVTPEPWAKDEELFDRMPTPRGDGASGAFV